MVLRFNMTIDEAISVDHIEQSEIEKYLIVVLNKP